MTVGEMLDRMDARELYSWRVFDRLEYEDAKRATKKLHPPPTSDEDSD